MMLKKIIAKPLTQNDFAPYGEVLTMPDNPGRMYFQAALGNLRPNANPSISTILKDPGAGLPFEIKMMERHEFSSQSFMPVQVKTWMIVVALNNQRGQPDVDRAQAFLADASQGITYRPNVWHHELTVFHEPAKFNIFMWRDETASDEEFFQVPPFWVTAF